MDSTYQDCTLLHVDADGFFAGVEQALTPALRGKPVVTGSERGIIAAASYEAQAQGIKRGLELHEVRQNCPGLVVLPSDYETYSLYSRHLYGILRRFTPCVEEYSIDEAFADLTGCGGVLGHPLESVAKQLRMAVSEEMGLTVSVGISLTKTLAKLCSKFRKPNGQTILRREHVPLMLKRTPIAKVWKLGSASAAKLQSHGISTACDFTRMDESLVLRLLHKPGHETWRELRGERVFALDMERKQTYDTMMKSHTFSPPNGDRRFVFAEALNNMTTAMAKLRRHNIPKPDVLITGQGTEIHYAPDLTRSDAWVRHINHLWNPQAVREILADMPGLLPQPKSQQSPFKISYYFDHSVANAQEIRQNLLRNEQAVNAVFSFGQFLDVVPVRASKGLAMRWCAEQLGFALENTLVCGVTGADTDMLLGNTQGAVVSNQHLDELSEVTCMDSIYVTEQAFAAGVLEAIAHFDFFANGKDGHAA